tara:strand:- start:1817 stop:2080 length:264 start_codon:yes stop_codon:yes gene_type:complete
MTNKLKGSAHLSDEKLIHLIINSDYLDQIPSGMTVLVESLFNYERWSGFKKYTRTQIGEMVALLVEQKELPLRFIDSPNPPQRYKKC